MEHSLDAIPRIEDINCFDSLDERVAVEHFLGKTLTQAEHLFRENAGYYMEDLMWMGVPAFCFYVQAAIRYIQSEFAVDDHIGLRGFASALEFRLECDSKEIVPIATSVVSACAFILHHWDRFDVPDFDSELKDRFIKLQKSFSTLLHKTENLG